MLILIPDRKSIVVPLPALALSYNEQNHFLFHKGNVVFEIAFLVEQVTVEIPNILQAMRYYSLLSQSTLKLFYLL